ncbi:Hypothetical predicted protein [Mytilus galloprovincialis]|uniref:Uncharacterized protein n=1 Tax=Mytilus galloprovincialis TaxID=29158 RepID=A0A8B6CMC4_MYTGA|nr:Hypothetical predicted protein [Mytilus galloprovincialis]
MENQLPQLVSDAVLVKSGAMPEGSETVKGYDFNNGVNYHELLESYKRCGFQATNFETSLSMDINSGSHILVELLMYIQNFGNFSSSTDGAHACESELILFPLPDGAHACESELILSPLSDGAHACESGLKLSPLSDDAHACESELILSPLSDGAHACENELILSPLSDGAQGPGLDITFTVFGYYAIVNY